MSIDPANHNWERQLEGGLPDCRVKAIDREANRVAIGRMQWDKVYCANCGQLTGAVPPNVPHVFFICDPCVAAFGPPANCIQVSE